MAYKDKKDQANCSRRFYEKNKDLCKQRARAHNKKYRKRNREYVNAYLREHFCVDCAEDDIRVLDFDHMVGEKRATISYMVRSCCSIKKIQEEIDKCVVRCSNCHRLKTRRTLWKTTQDHEEDPEHQPPAPDPDSLHHSPDDNPPSELPQPPDE